MRRGERLRVLIVGAGNIAGKLDQARSPEADPLTHAGAYRRDGRFEIVACVEPDEASRADFVAHWPVKHSFPSIDQVPHDLGIDVVSICSPTSAHLADVESALRLHPALIFCEKPIAPTLADSEALVERCRAAGIPLAVNHTRRWAADVAELRADLKAGRWGELRSITGTYTKGVLNNGSHLIDLVHFLVEEPLEVAWAGRPKHDFREDDPTISAVLRTPSGLAVHLATGDAADFAHFELQLLTSAGLVTMEAGGLQWRMREAVDSAEFRNYRVLDRGRFVEGRYSEAMRLAVANLYQALAFDDELASTGETALAAHRVCHQIKAAACAAEDRQLT